ncbi:hypothetical protein MYIN104542_15690 [Mycobacterium intermedium]
MTDVSSIPPDPDDTRDVLTDRHCVPNEHVSVARAR